MMFLRPYTLDEANALVPYLGEQIDRLREALSGARATYVAAEEHKGAGVASTDGGHQTPEMPPELKDALARHEADAAEAMRALARVAAQPEVLDPFVVEVPALRAGRRVKLGFVEGQDSFSLWRDPDGAVRPIDDPSAFGASLPL